MDLAEHKNLRSQVTFDIFAENIVLNLYTMTTNNQI